MSFVRLRYNRAMKRKGYLIFLLLVLVASGLFLKRNVFVDWYKLRGYNPPVEVVELADKTTLLENWRRLFYVNRPEVAEPAAFNTHCRENEFTIVLGCYISGQNGIYLLNVTDERLEGIKEVTAAHEFLHAAYERLGRSERDRIDALLTQTYVNLKNTRIRDTIELYRKKDPGVVTNELHSILGTEVRELPAGLNEYYRRYFSDRLKIVAYSEQYEQAFVERRDAVREYAGQLAALKPEIDALGKSLKQTEDELKAQKSQMESLRSSGKTNEYNAVVPVYNAKANQYNRDFDRLNELIVRYNELVQRHNSIVAEEAELIDAIDSRDIVTE